MIGAMGDDERPDAPSLEAPTLGRLFGRRKDKAAEPTSEPAAPADDSAPAASAPASAPADWAPVEEPAPVPVDEPAAVEETVVLAPEPAPEPVSAPAPAPAPTTAPAPAPVADLGPLVAAREAAAEEQPPRAPRPTLTVSGRVASAVTGLVIGLLVVVLTAGSLALCESVRGVSSCGGGPGFALLVAVTAAMVALGGLMLRLARVPDPTSTSFLAVGLLCVLSLLFLLDVLEEWWMIIVIPLLSTGTFLLSHWVTTAVVESD
jgi:hypothetical protein